MEEEKLVHIDLETAKSLYKSGNDTFKNIALQLYTENELDETRWENIKSFEDACNALGLVDTIVNDNLKSLNDCYNGSYLKALYKLEIIRQALNKDFDELSLFDGNVYYPFIVICDNFSDANRNENEKASPKYPFIVNHEIRYVVLSFVDCSKRGICNHSSYIGSISPELAILGCCTEDIAMHFGKYFTREIFDAMYSKNFSYNWVE
jgi:hypothetical protein